PVKDGVGSDLNHAGGGPNAYPLGQARQDAHDQFSCRLLAMKDRAVGFQKIPVASEALQLSPRAATGMAISPQVVEPQPAAIVTSGVGTKVHRGVHGTRASVGGGHGIGPDRRRWSALPDFWLTQDTVGLVRQARKRCRLAGAFALGLSWHGWSGQAWLGPSDVHHDEEPHENA